MSINCGKYYSARHLKCTSKIEAAFYSTRSMISLLCVHCGESEVNNVSYKSKQEVFTTVYPACDECINKNLREVCIGPKSKAKKKVPRIDIAQLYLAFNGNDKKKPKRKATTLIDFFKTKGEKVAEKVVEQRMQIIEEVIETEKTVTAISDQTTNLSAVEISEKQQAVNEYHIEASTGVEDQSNENEVPARKRVRNENSQANEDEECSIM